MAAINMKTDEKIILIRERRLKRYVREIRKKEGSFVCRNWVHFFDL